MSEGYGTFIGKAILIGVVVGVGVGAIGVVMELPTALTGGITGIITVLLILKIRRKDPGDTDG